MMPLWSNSCGLYAASLLGSEGMTHLVVCLRLGLVDSDSVTASFISSAYDTGNSPANAESVAEDLIAVGLFGFHRAFGTPL